jgi:uncharacterized protein YdeI (YjbR/CyaY-like superfamily)
LEQKEQREQHYFKSASEWRKWLHENHDKSTGVYLIFYKVNSANESMRWDEAVKVALCFGWIDSTVRRLDHERRMQTFTPRKDNSTWSKLNKIYIEKLIEDGLMHQSGLSKIEKAKQSGTWEALDEVEELIIPKDLEAAFAENKLAYDNYMHFSPSYRKSYLYWLNQAKQEETRNSRIKEIVSLCEQYIKSR